MRRLTNNICYIAPAHINICLTGILNECTQGLQNSRIDDFDVLAVKNDPRW